MMLRFKPRDVDKRERALWGDLTSLGMVFPIAITVGFFLGRWVGGRLGHPAVGQYVGLAWGIAAGFWELYKTTQRLDRLDAAQQAEPVARDAGAPQDPKDGPHGA
jgi:hypothetical protein